MQLLGQLGFCVSLREMDKGGEERKMGVIEILMQNIFLPHSLGTADGGWGNWRNWGICSTHCGTGTQTRSRECDQPKPHNGRDCVGDWQEFQVCGRDNPCSSETPVAVLAEI